MGEAPADDRPYAFGDVVVDPRAHRVLRNGIDLALEPKAFAVLLVLLREAGSIVPREALLDAVWGHRHVTPAVLNRIIAMLRRALGDDAEQPRWIRTVYGTGYGFIGELRREARVADEATPQPAPNASGGAGMPSLPGPDASGDAASQSRATPPASVILEPGRQRRRLLPWAAVAVIGAFAAILGVGSRNPPPSPAQQLAPAPTAPDAPTAATTAAIDPQPATRTQRIAVMPMRAAADDAALTDLANGITDSLIQTLSRQPYVSVTARESVDRAAATGATPQAAIEALRVDLLLQGTLSVDSAGNAQVSVALFRAPGGEPILFAYARPRAQVFRVLGPLLDDLARAGLPLGDEAGSAALRVGNERVQDLYWQAQMLAAGSFRGEQGNSVRQSIAKLDELLALDPDFALAHALRSLLYSRLGNLGVLSIGEAGEQAVAAAKRAIALAPDLAEGHLALGFATTMQWRSVEALGPAQRALEIAPNDYRALSLMGNVLAYLGRIDESQRFNARATELNPLLPWVMVRNGWANVLAGRPGEALADIESLQSQVGSGARRFVVPRIHMAYGQLAKSLQSLGPATADEPTLGAAARAATLQLLGDLDGARTALQSRNIKLPAAPLYIDTMLRQALLDGTAKSFAESLERSDPPPAQAPWLGISHAIAVAYAGDRRNALRELSQIFADPHQRELAVYSWFAASSGLSRIADWISLRREQGIAHASELAAYDAFIAAMTAGGVRAPMLAYHRAVSAALHDDPATADRLLGEAIAAGWLDSIALRFDLAWAPHSQTAWFAARRDEISLRIDNERRAAGISER